MKNYFIINPAAGKKRQTEKIRMEIESAAKKTGATFDIYETRSPGDGEAYVRNLCEKKKGEALRFFACGGDGTLNEVVNGACCFKNAHVGCVPLGTGNDFIRNFPEAESFLDLEKQLWGQSREIDLIRYETVYEDAVSARYCVNMFNIGFDCNVVDQAAKLKRFPLVKGPFAYLLGIAVVLIKKKGANLQIEFSGEERSEERRRSGKILLIAIANGCFCGGGIKGVPKAAIDDGVMDVSIIENVSRIKFITLFSKYCKGTHLETKDAYKIVDYRKCKILEIKSNGLGMRLCADGEITDADTVRFENVPKRLQFSVPAQ